MTEGEESFQLTPLATRLGRPQRIYTTPPDAAITPPTCQDNTLIVEAAHLGATREIHRSPPALRHPPRSSMPRSADISAVNPGCGLPPRTPEWHISRSTASWRSGGWSGPASRGMPRFQVGAEGRGVGEDLGVHARRRGRRRCWCPCRRCRSCAPGRGRSARAGCGRSSRPGLTVCSVPETTSPVKPARIGNASFATSHFSAEKFVSAYVGTPERLELGEELGRALDQALDHLSQPVSYASIHSACSGCSAVSSATASAQVRPASCCWFQSGVATGSENARAAPRPGSARVQIVGAPVQQHPTDIEHHNVNAPLNHAATLRNPVTRGEPRVFELEVLQSSCPEVSELRGAAWSAPNSGRRVGGRHSGTTAWEGFPQSLPQQPQRGYATPARFAPRSRVGATL